VSVLLGNGNGTFAAQQTFAAVGPGGGPVSLAVTDVDGDSRPDLIVMNQFKNSVSVLLGNGNGTFQAQQSIAAGYFPRALAVVDVNGDGKPDQITATSTTDTGPGFLRAKLNSSAGTFPFASINGGLLTVRGTAVGDLISVADSAGSVTATLNGTPSSAFTAVTGIEVFGAAGDDTISLAGVPIGATVFGAGGNESITGGALGDSVKDGKGADTVGGAGGNDTIVGGGDDDSLKGGAGDDSIIGGPGNDVLHGGPDNDTLFGGIGNDTDNGNAGNDSITAGSGSSQLIAGTGSDTLVGSTTAGFGADTITLTSNDSVLASANDVIVGRDASDTVIVS
jgi:Ca2+-binding RTX toxin-like protein